MTKTPPARRTGLRPLDAPAVTPAAHPAATLPPTADTHPTSAATSMHGSAATSAATSAAPPSPAAPPAAPPSPAAPPAAPPSPADAWEDDGGILDVTVLDLSAKAPATVGTRPVVAWAPKWVGPGLTSGLLFEAALSGASDPRFAAGYMTGLAKPKKGGTSAAPVPYDMFTVSFRPNGKGGPTRVNIGWGEREGRTLDRGVVLLQGMLTNRDTGDVPSVQSVRALLRGTVYEGVSRYVRPGKDVPPVTVWGPTDWTADVAAVKVEGRRSAAAPPTEAGEDAGEDAIDE